MIEIVTEPTPDPVRAIAVSSSGGASHSAYGVVFKLMESEDEDGNDVLDTMVLDAFLPLVGQARAKNLNPNFGGLSHLNKRDVGEMIQHLTAMHGRMVDS